MLSITLICTGRLREPHYLAACAEYEKRLKALCAFEIIELPEEKLPKNPSQAQILSALKKEAAEAERHIPASAAKVALCVEGRELSSTELADYLDDCANTGRSRICFIIGSSYGLDEGFKQGCDLRLSMSRMTFPHHLARVMLSEQIYRALGITGGSRYHK